MYNLKDKIVVITHNDMDGIGPNILVSLYNNMSFDIRYEFEIINCSYDDVDDIVLKTLQRNDFINPDNGNVKYLVITDLSIKAETAAEVDKLNKDKKIIPFLFDHHVDRNGISKYEWCIIEQEKFGSVVWYKNEPDLRSGTKYFYEFMCHILHVPPMNKGIEFIVDAITYYDTWYWATLKEKIEKYEQSGSLPEKLSDKNVKLKCATRLNDLYYLYGKDDFVQVITEIYKESYLNKEDLPMKLLNFLKQFDIIAKSTERTSDYYTSKEENITKLRIRVPEIGVVVVGCMFYDNDISNVGHMIAEKYDDIDVAAIIQLKSNKISYRSIKDTPQADCGALAELLGGGGKFHTAGSQISEELRTVIASMIFESSYKK